MSSDNAPSKIFNKKNFEAYSTFKWFISGMASGMANTLFGNYI
jgi:hypothetical protein